MALAFVRRTDLSSLSLVGRGPVSQGFGVSLSLKSWEYLHRVKTRNGVISDQENCTENAAHGSVKCCNNIISGMFFKGSRDGLKYVLREQIALDTELMAIFKHTCQTHTLNLSVSSVMYACTTFLIC